MSNTTIAVGVDDSDVSRDALEFAAREADRRLAPLLIAHAYRDHETAPDEAGTAGFQVARQADEFVAAAYPHLDRRVVTREGRAAKLLVELSGDADLLVVGTHRAGRLRGFVLGSVSQQVAARAKCPVITLSGPPENAAAPIVLGASASTGGLAAARFAYRQAALWGRPVRAMRSTITEDWALSTAESAVALNADVLRAAAQANLDVVLRIAAEEFPQVAVTGEVCDQSPFAALPAAAAEASLLVIGSRRGRSSPLPHLGPVAAWVLHQVTCPLALVGYGD